MATRYSRFLAYRRKCNLGVSWRMYDALDAKTCLTSRSEPFRSPCGHAPETAVHLGRRGAEDEIAQRSLRDLDVLVRAQDVDLRVGQHDSENENELR